MKKIIDAYYPNFLLMTCSLVPTDTPIEIKPEQVFNEFVLDYPHFLIWF